MIFTSTKKKLEPKDFHALAATLGERPILARKTGLVAARPADSDEQVRTRWNGEETTNTARSGDWVVTALDDDGAVLRDDEGSQNSYVISGERFGALYGKAGGPKARKAARGGASEFGEIYEPTSEVQALYLPDGFDILAPWGERQHAAHGYLLLSGDEVYGNHVDTFDATYRRIEPDAD